MLCLSLKKTCSSRLMKEVPRSKWTKAGIRKMENKVVRHLITVVVETSGQGNMNGNLEYSLITWRKNLFPLLLGKGPLKSMLILSNGCVALMSGTFSG